MNRSNYEVDQDEYRLPPAMCVLVAYTVASCVTYAAKMAFFRQQIDLIELSTVPLFLPLAYALGFTILADWGDTTRLLYMCVGNVITWIALVPVVDWSFRRIWSACLFLIGIGCVIAIAWRASLIQGTF